jgi:hypothetical protein
MIGGKRRACSCRVNQKGGCHGGHGDGQRQPRTQQSVLKAMKEGCAVGRGGVRRRFRFSFIIKTE